MPSTIDPYLVGVWTAVGLFTSVGWAVGAWIVGQLTRPRKT